MQPSKSLRTAAKLLLNVLIKKFGGHSEVARAIGADRQLIYIACDKGYVTLSTVYLVSKALQIDPWALSYVKLYQVFGEESKNFEKVVKTTGVLDSDEIASILKVYKQ